MAIIYLHGFASTGHGPKKDALVKAFPDETIVAPDLPHNPVEAIQNITNTMQRLITRGEQRVLFIGTSLGGFYAWFCSAKFDAPAVLVNPAIRPDVTTSRYLGRNKIYSTGKEFEWTKSHIDDLKPMISYAEKNYNPKLITVAVSFDDAVISAHDTIEKFNRSAVHTYDGEGHRFNNFHKIIPHVRDAYHQIKEQITPMI